MEKYSEYDTVLDIIHEVKEEDYLNEEETKEFIQFIHDNFNDPENPISIEEYERRIQLLNNGTVSRMQYEVLKVCVDLQRSEKLEELNEKINER